jgi:hypothetical protein
MRPRPDVGAVLDACCVIDLYASGAMEDILGACGRRHLIPAIALDEAAYVLRDDPEAPGRLVRSAIDLRPAVRAGLIAPCEPEGGAELDLFVRLAAHLDDAEACCVALGVSRRLRVATDDRKAGRIAGSLGGAVITTPELLELWSRRASPSRKPLAAAIGRIERYGRFVPPSASPLAAWWRRNST